MFNFFSKERYLVDLLEGFVDIHNHLLPGIDDGAQTVDESISLIKGFSEFGVKNFICTPHIMHNYHDNTPKTIKESFKTLKTALVEHQINDVSIDYSAEHMIDDNFENILEESATLSLRKEYLLVEMSYLQASINFDVAIKKVIQKGFFPVLAHPERYGYLHNISDSYQKMKNGGIKFQLNLLSLGNFYGPHVKKITYFLLERGMIDFLGTDVHNNNHLSALKKIILTNKYSNKISALIQKNIATFY